MYNWVPNKYPPPLKYLAHKMWKLLLKCQKILQGSILSGTTLPLDQQLSNSPPAQLK